MNLAAALPHIHEVVSGIAAYTYTSSRVNVSSAATTAQVVALHSKVFFRKHGSGIGVFSPTRRAGLERGCRRSELEDGLRKARTDAGLSTIVNAEIFPFLTRSASDRQTQIEI